MKEILQGQPNPDSNVTQNVDIPAVLRNARGRVLWKLPGNTSEQNEEMGIQNIQGLFLEAFPKFNEDFPRGEDGNIPEDKREEALGFIQKNIGDTRKFKQTLGTSPLSKGVASYFGGSLHIVLAKSFTSWGIIIATPDNVGKSNTEWVPLKVLMKELGISRSVKTSYLKGVPTMIGFYGRGNKTVLYKRSEATEALDGFLNLPIAQTDLYTDEQGQEWGTLYYLARTFKISRGTLSKMIRNVSTVKGRSRYGGERTFYNKTEAQEAINIFVSLPEVAEDSRYRDKNGEVWVELYGFSITAGVTKKALLRKLEGVRFIEGRSRSGSRVILYNESDLNLNLSTFLSLPRADRETKQYVDGHGTRWVSLNFLHETTGFSYYRLRQLLIQKVKSIMGRDSGGHKVDLYDEVEALGIVRSTVDTIGGISPDQANEQLMRYLETRDE